MAAFTTLAENFLPQLIAIPKVRYQSFWHQHAAASCLKSSLLQPLHVEQWAVALTCHGISRATIPLFPNNMSTHSLPSPHPRTHPPIYLHALQSVLSTFVRSTLSLTFVIAAARVVFNIKGRIVRESTWQLELKGDLTRQRRLEAIDKLMSVLTLLVASVFSLQVGGWVLHACACVWERKARGVGGGREEEGRGGLMLVCTACVCECVFEGLNGGVACAFQRT